MKRSMYYPTDELVNAFFSFTIVLETLLKELSDFEIFQRYPNSSNWAIIEILCHLRDSERVALERTLLMLNSNAPKLEGFNQDQLTCPVTYTRQ